MKIYVAIILGLLMLTKSLSAEKLAFTNAKIFDGKTVSANDAFVVENGRFLKIGKTDDIKKTLGKNETAIDLQGALVLPGFIEAHAHLLGLGQSKLNLDLRHLSKSAIVDKLMKQSKKQAAGTWLTGRGWDQNLWDDKEFPHKDLLRTIENPVYLRRVDGHAAWVNDVVLKKAGIDKNTKDPDGGKIIRDQQGQATGVFIDNAIDLVSKYLDKPSKADLEQYYNLGEKEALSLGITSFHDAGASADAIAIFEELAQKNKLSLRLHVMIDGGDQSLVDKFLARGPLLGDFLTVRSIKYFADGALGSRGAFLLAPYHDHAEQSGLMLTDRKILADQTKKAIDAGFSVATHAIGDGANRVVLDAYEDALTLTKAKNTRLRVEHAQLIDPSDHARFKKLSIIASMQPIHCTSDMAWVPDRLGAERIKNRAYPWRSLLDQGVVLAFGSDAPVEDINPILGIYAAVTRANLDGTPEGGFMPEQKLKLIEALEGYHHGAAYAEFNEHQKGKIAEGFFADFVVFDTNLLHPIKAEFIKAKPVMTVVNGKIVYQRNHKKIADSRRGN